MAQEEGIVVEAQVWEVGRALGALLRVRLDSTVIWPLCECSWKEDTSCKELMGKRKGDDDVLDFDFAGKAMGER